MQDTPLIRATLGSFLILLGLALIIFHEPLRKFQDRLSKYDPLLRYGDWWTGKYTRGGIIFTHAVAIIFGLILLMMGILILFHWVD